MIVPEDNLKVLLGLGSSITDEEQTFITLLHPLAEGAVKAWIKYDPEQKPHTQNLPQDLKSGGPGFSERDWPDVVGDRVLWRQDEGGKTLQLTHIPLRVVASVHVDTAARHGSASGAFAADTEWTQGEDFWAEWEEDNVCLSGMLYAYGGWDYEPGSVRVAYTGGYSADELAGTATTTSTAGGVYTNAGLDASGITTAVLLTAAKSMHTWQSLKKRTAIGFVPGAMQSERLGDYSYTLAPGADLVSAMKVDLPAEAKQALEPYLHYGVARL